MQYSDRLDETSFSERESAEFAAAHANILRWGAFDEGWYRAQVGDISGDPVLHYLLEGERSGVPPCPLFDVVHVAAQLNGARPGHILSTYIETGWRDGVNPHPLFDIEFYLHLYGELLRNDEPLAYYMKSGWRLGHDPNPVFDAAWYALAHNLRAHEHPVLHYLQTGAAQGLEPAPGFDGQWVMQLSNFIDPSGFASTTKGTPLETYLAIPEDRRSPSAAFWPMSYANQVGADILKGMDPFWHYRRIGHRKFAYTGAAFDAAYYRSQEPVLSALEEDPIAHYLHTGARAGRNAHPLFDEDWYIRQPGCACRDRSLALSHYILEGWRQGLDPHPLFDSSWYLEQYKDVKGAGLNPWLHYLSNGWREGRQVNKLFDTDWYLRTNPDVARLGIEPAGHYARHGIDEGRDPGPDFSTHRYLIAYAAQLDHVTSPLSHYLRQGERQGCLTFPVIGDADNCTISALGVVETPLPVEAYHSWLEVNPLTVESTRRLKARLAGAKQDHLPLISVIMPCYESDPDLLSEAIESVLTQAYENWELCICDDASPSNVVAGVVKNFSQLDGRIKYVRNPSNAGIGGATNAAASIAAGEILAFLDHDDLLHPHALGEIALAVASRDDVDIIYTDDDKIDEQGRRFAPQFKPDWSPILLLSFMYISHLFCIRKELFDNLGGIRPAFDGSQDYDLALRASERVRNVVHIPKVLYHWRAVKGSTAVSGDAKPEAIVRGNRAVQEALDRRGVKAQVRQPDFAEASKIGVFEPQFGDVGPSVTIIIPTRNRVDLLRVCVESLKLTTYRNFEILIIDNESDDPDTLAYMSKSGARVLRVASPPGGFSFANVINEGVRSSTSDYVLLLNNDTMVRNPEWLSQMMGYAQMQGVGAVGARLLYEDLKVQHGGITHGLHEGMAGHSFKLLADWDPGYLQLARTSREVSGVTAACMLTPRALFEEIGGLDDHDFNVAYNDVDFCYRLVDAGYACIQCASAELFHFEGKTRGFVDNPREITAMRKKYRGRRDPFYNPNLSLENEQFEVARAHVPDNDDGPFPAIFVSHNFNHEGAPNSLFELAAGLKAAGRAAPMVIAPVNGPLRQRYLDAGIEAQVVENPLLGWLPAPELKANLQRMGQTFLYAGCRVVVANTAESFWAVAAAAEVGLPSIWIIRESEPWQTYFTHLPPHIAQLAYDCFKLPYRVVFVAQSTLEAWKPLDSKGSFTLNRNGLDTGKLIGSFVGLDRTSLRSDLGIDADSCLFTCVGTVCERKGQLELVRGFGMLPQGLAEKAAVAIIGDRAGEYSDRLHAEIESLPLPYRQKIKVLPETSKARNYLVASDVFVCTSRVESYPRVTLEAMAAGLPIISTAVWGITEQVRDNYNALLYQPGQADDLCNHLAAMIEQPLLRSQFAERSIPVFESLPDFDFMRDRYADLIDQAAGSR